MAGEKYKIYKRGQEIVCGSGNNETRYLVVSDLHLNSHNEICVDIIPFINKFNKYEIRIKSSEINDYHSVIGKKSFDVGDNVTLIDRPDNDSQRNIITTFLNKLFDVSDYSKRITKVIEKDGMIFYKTKEDGNNVLLDLSLFYRKVCDSDKVDLAYIKDIILKDRKVKSKLEKINPISNLMLSNSLKTLAKRKKKETMNLLNDFKEKNLNLRNCMKGVKQSLQKLNNCKDVVNVVFDEESNKLNIYTPLIFSEFERGKKYPIGHYKFEIYINSRDDGFSFKGIRLEGKSSYHGGMHHCIQSDGKICFGEYNIFNLSKDGKLFEIYLIFLNVLRNFPIAPDFNPSEFYRGLSREFRDKTNHMIRDVDSSKSDKIYSRR